jgi:hypothetical protein
MSTRNACIAFECFIIIAVFFLEERGYEIFCLILEVHAEKAFHAKLSSQSIASERDNATAFVAPELNRLSSRYWALFRTKNPIRIINGVSRPARTVPSRVPCKQQALPCKVCRMKIKRVAGMHRACR